MKPFGNERFMALIPLAVLVFVVTVLAGGPGPLIDMLDRIARQAYEVLASAVSSVVR
jgi:hypothetical protein